MIEANAILERGADGQGDCAHTIGDDRLLERFALGDEEAFAALVRRHGPAVMRICQGVLRDRHEAEDVFQTTFLVLARKAGTVTWQESVRPWLSAVAQRLARHAKARSIRWRLRERPVDEESAALAETRRDDPVTEVARRELRSLLERELHGLPEKYREPVVLCYLEGKTNEEAARELGWPAGSMSRRLSRARAILRDRLSVRGLTVVTGILGVVAALLWGFSDKAPPKSFDRAQVTTRMQMFKPVADHGAGIEDVLQMLAQERRPAIPPERLEALAVQTEQLAKWLEEVDPGRDRSAWLGYAQGMKGAAQELSAAAHTKQPASAYQAARKLMDTCRRCHETFGE